MTTTELLPCPFCGAPDPPFGHSWAGGFFGTVSCGDCGAEVNSGIGATSADEAQAEAITAWNTRTPSNTREDALEEAARIAHDKAVEWLGYALERDAARLDPTAYKARGTAAMEIEALIRAKLNPTNPTAGQSGEDLTKRGPLYHRPDHECDNCTTPTTCAIHGRCMPIIGMNQGTRRDD